ncbi:MAG: hypothetical protein SFU27_11485 [Thermonemataceae bacterium]|nr:hypothetical protein [Thermonemataceae bacterium]
MKKLSLFFLLLLALASCKKSVEGETSTWNANVNKLKKLKASYPSFADVLDKDLKDAQKKWEDAQKISNEEEKIKKMSEANYTFNTGFVYELGTLESKLEAVNKKNKDLRNAMTDKNVNLDKSDLKEVLRTNDDAKDALTNVEKMLSKGDKSSDQAYRTIKEANSRLSDIERRVDQAMKLINDSKKPAGKKGDKDKSDSTKVKKKKKKIAE